MNITISEIGLLDKVRFGVRKDSENQPEVSNEQQTPEAGMKALMFRGMNNLLSNPYLAASIRENEDAGEEKPEDKSNVAFKANPVMNNGMKKAAKALAIGAIALGLGGAVTSCKDNDDDEYMKSLIEALANQQNDTAKVVVNVNTVVTVNVDMSSLDAYIARQEERDRINDQRWQEFSQWMQDWRTWAANDTQHSVTVEQYLASLNGKADTYIELIMRQGYDRAEADSMYRAYLERITQGLANGTTTIQGAINDLYALVNDIKDIAKETLATVKDVRNGQNKLVQLTKDGNSTREELLVQGKAFREDFKAFMDKVELIRLKLTQIDWDVNMNTYVLANKLSMNHSELMEILGYLGVTVNDNLKTIQDKIDNNTNTLGYLAYNGIVAILDRLEKGTIELKDAKEAILAELQKIGADVEDIKNTVHEILEVAYKTYKSVNQGFYNVGMGFSQVFVNQAINNMKLEEIKKEQKATKEEVKKANNYLKELLKNEKELKEIIENRDHQDRQALEEMFKILNMHIDDYIGKSTAQIVAAINNASGKLDKMIEQNDVIIEGLDYLKNIPGLDLSKLEDALKDLGTNLTNVINNGVTNLSGDLTNVVNAINEVKQMVQQKLDAILAQLRTVNSYLEKLANKQDQSLDILEEIRDDGKARNDQLATLNTNVTMTNVYAGNIEKYDSLIYEKIKDLSPSMTPAQLKAVLGDALVEVLANQGIIIDNLKDLDEIKKALKDANQQLKDGNALLKKIYDAIKAYPDYTDQLANLAITVICQCSCGSYNNDEGIRELENIIHGNGGNVKAQRINVKAYKASVAKHAIKK